MRKYERPRDFARRDAVSLVFSFSPLAYVEIHAQSQLALDCLRVPNTRVLAYSNTAKNAILFGGNVARHFPFAAHVANLHPSSTQHGEV